MKRNIITIVFSCFISSLLFSQEKDGNRLKNYIFDLIHTAPEDQNHLFTVQYNYMLTPWGKTIGAQGGVATFGLNFARFFSKQITFGISADIKLIPGLATNKPSQKFKNDFKDNYTPILNNSKDSANSVVFYNNLFGNGVSGNNMFNIGLMFAPFPQRFGGIQIQVKTGVTGFEFHNNIYGNTFINDGGNDKVPMAVSKNWRYEISFKPATLFGNSYYALSDGVNANVIWKSFILSFYYEYQNFKSAAFNGTYLRDIVSQPFLDNYGVDHRFGLKLGFAFY
jgi:hypothetical protein